MINPWDGEGIFHLQSSPRLLVNHLGPGERRAVVLVPRAGKLRLPSLPPPLVPKGNSSNRPRHGHLLASPAAPGHECRNQYRCYFTRKKKKNSSQAAPSSARLLSSRAFCIAFVLVFLPYLHFQLPASLGKLPPGFPICEASSLKESAVLLSDAFLSNWDKLL